MRTNRKLLVSYIVGFALSIALTVLAFWSAAYGASLTIPLILIAALLQLAVQLIFFLHLASGSDAESRVPIFAFTLIIVGILVGGTFWIMTNLERLHMHQTTIDDVYEHGEVSPANELH